jgi:AcrR family transcriptional regulator
MTRLRAAEARARTLAAARGLFGARGYRGTTVRGIAAASGVHASIVMRHFGSKAALFALAAEFDLALPAAGTLDRASAGRALARHFLARWEGDAALPALLAAAAGDETARERVAAIFAGQVAPLLAGLGLSPPATALVAAQALGLAYARYVLRLPGIATLPADALEPGLARALQAAIDG